MPYFPRLFIENVEIKCYLRRENIFVLRRVIIRHLLHLEMNLPGLGKSGTSVWGGVAFDYFFHKDLEYNPSQQLDIFMPGNKFYLRNLPCNIVYDILHLKRTANPLFLAKRIGLQFRELTHSQTTHLMFFLENHTVQ